MQWSNIKRSLALIVLQFVSCGGVAMFFRLFRAGAEHVMVSFGVLVAVTLDGLVVGLRKEFSKLAGCWRGWGCCDSLWIFMD